MQHCATQSSRVFIYGWKDAISPNIHTLLPLNLIAKGTRRTNVTTTGIGWEWRTDDTDLEAWSRWWMKLLKN